LHVLQERQGPCHRHRKDGLNRVFIKKSCTRSRGGCD
jgi:hypothetical protein